MPQEHIISYHDLDWASDKELEFIIEKWMQMLAAAMEEKRRRGERKAKQRSQDQP